jgi:uncharacterized RDD family membrane protein YckC
MDNRLQGDALELEYVGFWIRVAASLVDSFLIVLVLAPIGYLISGSRYFNDSVGVNGPSDTLISIALPAALTILFWFTRQATPGKMIFSARIVDARTGAVPNTAQWLLRYLGYFVSTLAFGLGFIWVGLDRRKQGWHDKIAGTVVVRPKRIDVDPLGINR